MSLPDEFLDAFPGRARNAPAAAPAPSAAPGGTDPRGEDADAPGVPVRSQQGDDSPIDPGASSVAGGLVPSPRGPRMGAEATDLPALDRPDLPDLGPGSPAGEPRELRLLSEVEVELTVELGRVKLPLRDLLSLGPGTVLELDRAADAPVDVLVNGFLVARGEVVVIDGEFGVRVTAVVER